MMKYPTLFALTIIMFFFSANVFSQESNQDKMLQKLALLDGSWKGFLEYLDYSDDKTLVKLPTECTAVFNKSGDDKYLSVKFVFDEGNGRTVTGEDAWTILDEGKTFFYDSTNYSLSDYKENKGHGEKAGETIVLFIFQKNGKDNNKDCTIQQIFAFSNNYFTIMKQIKYTDSQSFFRRHWYEFKRVN